MSYKSSNLPLINYSVPTQLPGLMIPTLLAMALAVMG